LRATWNLKAFSGRLPASVLPPSVPQHDSRQPALEDYLDSARLASLSPAKASGGAANASPPASIIPALPPVPGAPNWTATVSVGNQPHVIAAGSYLYSDGFGSLVVGDSYYHAPLINEGTLWMDGSIPANMTSGHWQYVLTGSVNIINRGTAVVLAHDDAPRVGQSDAFGFFRFHELDNSGRIFAWAEIGRAFALWSEDVPRIVNSGLVAAFVDAGLATAIHLDNGGAILNQAGGRILAEGPVATAISYYNAGLPSYSGLVYHVENAGLIQARSTNVDIASIAIKILHASHQTFRLQNSGTISAEIAIIDRSSTEGAYSPMQSSVQIIANLAGGVINGDIILDRGDDEIANGGSIVGYVLLGEGNDQYDTSAGASTGLIDLGWGADLFKGSADGDYVAGDDGNDLIEGNGGHDQLMGGANDDVIVGGAGSDGLFGEYGNDRIVTQGGDFAWGGAGDDRIELGDYGFEQVSGNEGFDTLVLPAGARILDLSLALAGAALGGFERIVLGGGKELVVRAADVPAMTGGGHALWLDGGATDRVDLVGAWVAGATAARDGIGYRRYDLGAESVYVALAATASVQAAGPAGATGLDPFAGGPLAPVPGEGPLDFTPNDKYLIGYVISQSTIINPEQTWWNDQGFPVLQSSGHSPTLTLTNYGHLLGLNPAFGYASVAGLSYVGQLNNYGTMSAVSTWDGAVFYPEDQLFSVTACSYGLRVDNEGTIEAITVHGLATGAWETSYLTNRNLIHAYSEHGKAVGADQIAVLSNQGTILAEGGFAAVGVHSRADQLTNAGRIEATIISGGAGESIGVQLSLLYYSWLQPYQLNNSGEIAADIAIQEIQGTHSGYVPVNVVNSGSMTGRIELSLSADRITNTGIMIGDIRLFDGNDVFDGRAGTHQGAIDGGAGDDLLVGGAGNDVLIGGTGYDRMAGGAGADLFVFTSLDDSGEHALRSDGRKLAPDLIAGFETGIDRIDLSAIDAVAGAGGDQAFTFIGNSAFTGHAGQLRSELRGAEMHIYADVDGNGIADFHIVAMTTILQASDFIL
jgi:Ca2+-binding RTX toxin-like protein